MQRVASRWGGPDPHPHLARQLVALVCSLRGSVCLYQGEELGLPEADVPFEALQDPYGKTFWPNFKGRDGCRTPLPWTAGDDAGFGAAQPWLPVPAAHRALSVAAQEADSDSTLRAARAFLAWRRSRMGLVEGSIRFFDAPEPVLAFERDQGSERLLLAFNLSAAGVEWELPPQWSGAESVAVPGVAQGALRGNRVVLPAHAVVVLEAVQ